MNLNMYRLKRLVKLSSGSAEVKLSLITPELVTIAVEPQNGSALLRSMSFTFAAKVPSAVCNTDKQYFGLSASVVLGERGCDRIITESFELEDTRPNKSTHLADIIEAPRSLSIAVHKIRISGDWQLHNLADSPQIGAVAVPGGFLPWTRFFKEETVIAGTLPLRIRTRYAQAGRALQLITRDDSGKITESFLSLAQEAIAQLPLIEWQGSWKDRVALSKYAGPYSKGWKIS